MADFTEIMYEGMQGVSVILNLAELLSSYVSFKTVPYTKYCVNLFTSISFLFPIIDSNFVKIEDH